MSEERKRTLSDFLFGADVDSAGGEAESSAVVASFLPSSLPLQSV